MAKGKGKGKGEEEELFPQTKEIVALLETEVTQDVVMIAIPSHDNKNQILGDAVTAEWASNAMKLMADLYVGGTAYQAHSGIYKTNDGNYLVDKPIIVESFASIEAIHDTARLEQLVGFAKRMGKATNQAAVMLVFGTVMYYIVDYGGV